VQGISDIIYEKVLEVANYKLDTGASVEEIAKEFNMTQALVYDYLGKRLLDIDKELYKKVKSMPRAPRKNKGLTCALKEKILEIAEYMLETGESVKNTGEKFGVSRTTLYNYFNDYLPEIDNEMYLKVQAVLSRPISNETALEIAKYRIEHKATYSELSEKFGFSENQISYFFRHRLKLLDNKLYTQIQLINEETKQNQEKILEIAKYQIEHRSSYSELAEIFGISKGTVEKYLNERLPEIDEILYNQLFLKRKKSEFLDKRVLTIAKYRLETGETYAEIAEKFNLSESCVYNYLHNLLPQIDEELYSRLGIKKQKTLDVSEIARYKLETGASDKEVGKKFGVSDSTIARYLNKISLKTDRNLYEQIMATRKRKRNCKGVNGND
jgi:transposase